MPDAAPAVAPAPYGTCRYCGDAVPPESLTCPICGSTDPIRARDEALLKGRGKSRFRVLQVGRSVVVVAVVVLLAVLMIQAAFTPPPVADNPLTQTNTYVVAPGGYISLGGYITGADYIQGNYTVMNPPGADLTLEIFNSTEFARFSSNQSSAPMQSQTPGFSERIVFSALYTDNYFFVFLNHYPANSGLDLTFYVTTTYESNVNLG
jgi:hypothetical protein